MQSGAGRIAVLGLLLLALPVVFTFHVLLLPRFAERNRTFCAQPTSLSQSALSIGFSRLMSLFAHARISARNFTTMSIQ